MGYAYPDPNKTYVPNETYSRDLSVGYSAWQRLIPLKDYVAAGYNVLMVSSTGAVTNINEYIIDGQVTDDNAIGLDIVMERKGKIPDDFAARLQAAPDAFKPVRYRQVFPAVEGGQ